jgi:hypothetical protein
VELPFTVAEFFSVFERYNLAIYPAQIAVYAAGAIGVAAVLRGGRAADLVASSVLASLWAFTGAGYFLGFFSGVSGIAVPAGALFVLQAALFVAAASSGRLRFDGRRERLGWVFVAYAMVLYPLLGAAAGHGFPRSPTFGVTPCPTTIFTWGMLLLASGAVPAWLVPIPLAWSAVGTSAAVQLGVIEDYGLTVAGAVGLVTLWARRRSRARALAGA